MYTCPKCGSKVERTDDICPKCNTKIEKIKVGGRGTYYCPKCQNLQK